MATNDQWDRKTRTTWSTFRPRGDGKAAASRPPPPRDFEELLTRSIERERDAMFREALYRTYLWTGGALITGLAVGLAAPAIYRGVSENIRMETAQARIRRGT